ncbi:MAG: transcription antitermination protein NusB, partial [Bdellovibrionales bacterium]|nr:transcription antitermination protein NusB [Bdellovibrionales bacterium]
MTNDSRRRQARELTLQVLFQLEFSPEINIKESIEYFKNQFEAHSEVYEFAFFLVSGVIEYKEGIDSVIKSKSINWNFDRIATVDKNILRIAIFEILHSNQAVPPITSV